MGNIEKGRLGEDLTAGYMLRHGMTIIERNYRRARCEIDIIALDGEVLVFAEVKARSTNFMGSGREAVDRRKQLNIIRAAQWYIIERHTDRAARFDVAEVDLAEGRVEYIKNAFEA